jgi:hypothetical protein
MCVIFEYIFVTWNNMQVFSLYYADRPPKNEPLLLMLGQHIHSSKMSLKLKKKSCIGIMVQIAFNDIPCNYILPFLSIK